ncbi:MAG: segregation/condensation protein A [Patescibacteria group bacterium]|nr:segregation/condensation protein A [Patescibacteria group bacterium]
MAYQVQTAKYQGPLEVLLQLIEEQKLEITDIALAQVTAQFLDYIKTLTAPDPNLLADFLTIASKLLVIKSKTLLPSLEEELEEEEGGPSLAEQLIIFKRFKLVARHLQVVEARGRYAFTREGNITDYVAFYPDHTVTADRLKAAMMALAKSLEEITKLPKQLVKEVISISEKIKDLQKHLSQRLEMKLSEALQKKTKTEIIVTFLAMLELVKQRIFSVEQEELFAEITIKKRA